MNTAPRSDVFDTPSCLALYSVPSEHRPFHENESRPLQCRDGSRDVTLRRSCCCARPRVWRPSWLGLPSSQAWHHSAQWDRGQPEFFVPTESTCKALVQMALLSPLQVRQI